MTSTFSSMTKCHIGEFLNQPCSCSHELTFKQLCVTCGADITHREQKNVNLDWMLGLYPSANGDVFRGLRASSKTAIRDIYESDLANLKQSKKLRLVLDFDETLIHTVRTLLPQQPAQSVDSVQELIHLSHDSMDVQYKAAKLPQAQTFVVPPSPQSKSIHDVSEEASYVCFVMGRYLYKVYIRPGLRDFLKNITTHFDVYIYTHGTDKYARRVLELLFQNSNATCVIQGIFARQNASSERSLKNLHKMLCNRSMSIVVDDRTDVWSKEDAQNVLKIAPFLGSARDNELAWLGAHLMHIHDFYFSQQKLRVMPVDVRDVIKYFQTTGLQEILSVDVDDSDLILADD